MRPSFVLLALALGLPAPALAEAPMTAPTQAVPAKPETAPSVTVTQLFRGDQTASGQPIRLPAGDVELVVSRYVIPPGAALPIHKHPYPRYAYVEAGTLRVSSADGHHVNVYRTGDVIVEMVDAWHSGAAEGTEPVRLLVFDQLPPGAASTVLQRAPGAD